MVNSDNRANDGSEKLIYNNNMTLGLAIGSKSTWEKQNRSPRLLRKSQSTTAILEKVLPTIPPWILVDAMGINKSLPEAPSSPSSHSSSSAPISPSHQLLASALSPALAVHTPQSASWVPQIPNTYIASPSPSSSFSSPSPSFSSPSPSQYSAQSSSQYSVPSRSSHSSNQLSKFVDAVRLGARSSSKRLPPKVQNAFRTIGGIGSKSSVAPEPKFEIIEPASICSNSVNDSRSDLNSVEEERSEGKEEDYGGDDEYEYKEGRMEDLYSLSTSDETFGSESQEAGSIYTFTDRLHTIEKAEQSSSIRDRGRFMVDSRILIQNQKSLPDPELEFESMHHASHGPSLPIRFSDSDSESEESEDLLLERFPSPPASIQSRPLPSPVRSPPFNSPPQSHSTQFRSAPRSVASVARPRLPSLVLPSPPARSTSLFPMPTVKPVSSWYYDRDLPPLPLPSVSSPGANS